MTRAELKAQINELEEMLTAAEVERDALKDEVLKLMRLVIQYKNWHIESLQQSKE